MIPKSVHYCWFGRNPLPKDVFDHIDSWKRYCPDVRGLIRSFTVLRAQAAELIAGITARSGKIAVWGASHQSFTILSSMGLSGKIAYIIDSAPFKQGKYSPVSHIPIVPPEHFFKEPVDAVIIIAPTYTDEIAESIRARFGRSVAVYAIRSEQLEEIRQK